MVSQRTHKRTDSLRRSVRSLFTRPPFQGNHLLGIALVLHGTSIPLLSQSALLHRFYGDLRAATQQQAARLTFTSVDGCGSKSRAWFSLLCPDRFLSPSFIIAKGFSCAKRELRKLGSFYSSNDELRLDQPAL